MALSWTLDKLGPMCRSADDCGLVLAAIAGRDTADPTTVARPFAYPETPKQGASVKRLRIGVIKDSTAGAMPAVRKNFEAAVEVLRKLGTVVEGVAFPQLPYGSAVSTIIQAEAASAFRDLLESGRARELRSPGGRSGGYPGAVVLAVDYLDAMRTRKRIRRELDALYARFDALVAPSRATVAPPVGVEFSKAYPDYRGGGPAIIPAGNLAGQPAISVPNGFGPNNLPTGLQFMGRAWGEARLLALAHAYQQATDWHRRRPRVAP
jgi:aspartyl-tRNA(Asn)/glutamyl-tRNA(Gln) amidotransferase subunit A